VAAYLLRGLGRASQGDPADRVQALEDARVALQLRPAGSLSGASSKNCDRARGRPGKRAESLFRAPCHNRQAEGVRDDEKAAKSL